MKMVDKTSQPTTNDTNATFSITATGKAFRILSDGLYSDKITAVIRELSCNAYDSHIAAGKSTVPFVVTLPSLNDPYFSVEDFGIGLSDADVYQIYTCYFASTKAGDNMQVGQLGLGSKSPFSIVNEFFVESKHNGEYRKYKMYFDANDIPRIEVIAQNTTPDSNGVKVSFKVSIDDMNYFDAKAKVVFKYFAVTPKVYRDGVSIDIQNEISQMKHSGWFMRPIKPYGHDNRPYAIMGNVAYPLDRDSIKGLTYLEVNLLQLPLVVQFQIGDFEISASRESIGYDDRSCENIHNRIAQVNDELYQELADTIATAKTEWDARQIYGTLFDNGSNYNLNRAMSKRVFKWNGIEIKSKTITLNLEEFYPHNAAATAVRSARNVKSGPDNITIHRVAKREYASYVQQCDKTHGIIFDDLPRNGSARVKHFLLPKAKEPTFEVTIFDRPTDGKGWSNLRARLGNPAIIFTSKLPVPPTKERVEKKTEDMMQYTYGSYKSYGNKKAEWSTTQYDADEGGFYVDHAERCPIKPVTNTPIDLDKVMKYGVEMGYIRSNTQVYAAKGYLRQRIHKLKHWVNIVDFLGEKLAADVALIEKNLNNVATQQMLAQMSCGMPKTIHMMPWDFRDENSSMRNIIETFKELHMIANTAANDSKTRSITDAARAYGIEIKNEIADPRINSIVTEFKHRYPMLAFMNNEHWNRDFKVVNDYVNMVDVSWVYFELSRPAPKDEEEN
jgi:hypothetical protein